MAKSKPDKRKTIKKSKPGKASQVVSKATKHARLTVRHLTDADYDGVLAIQRACFPDIAPWTRRQFSQHLAIFPEGQIGVTLDEDLVATSSSLIIKGAALQDQHSFGEVTGNSSLSSHDPDGDTLYGIDIAVLPEFRGKRLARRLYEARKQIAIDRNLRAMVIAGRMPGYHKHAKKLSPEEYLQRVMARTLRDPVITAQMANGFEPQHVIHGYLPSDRESCGNAVLMEWCNSEFVKPRPSGQRVIDDVRVAAVQYEMRAVADFDAFARQVEFFVETASEYRCDFICFPELLTNQLLTTIEPQGGPAKSARALHRYTDDYVALFSRLAIDYNCNIIGGTHLVVEGDALFNEAFLFHRDGGIDRQRKLHITPAEARWWGVQAGDELRIFDTDCGPVAILTCYDIEFPELARVAKAKGANLLFVPFNTDIRPAYMRVRNCAAARCVENSQYCVLSGPVGNLPAVDGTDIHYSQACILTPCDIPYPRDGIGAEATPNVETMLLHEIDMSLLRYTMHEGAVRTWLDRRTDLYDLRWKKRSIDKLGGAT